MIAPILPTFVYAVRCGEWIKIGVARDIANRMGGMRVNCPYPLTLVGSRQLPSAQDALRIESAVHRELAGQRHFGEWFRDQPIDPVAILAALYAREGLEPVSTAIDPRKPFSVFPEIEFAKATYEDIYPPEPRATNT
jgi:hypothetical protein